MQQMVCLTQNARDKPFLRTASIGVIYWYIFVFAATFGRIQFNGAHINEFTIIWMIGGEISPKYSYAKIPFPQLTAKKFGAILIIQSIHTKNKESVPCPIS